MPLRCASPRTLAAGWCPIDDVRGSPAIVHPGMVSAKAVVRHLPNAGGRQTGLRARAGPRIADITEPIALDKYNLKVIL